MSNPFRYFNSSPEIIRLVVMMYVRYPLSLRNVEDLLAERGIDISHETVRFWWNRIGPMFAAEIRKRRVAHMRAYPQWRWHLDEVFVKVNGKLCYLWRAVDHEGEVLEAVVTARRDKAAALKLLKLAGGRVALSVGECCYSDDARRCGRQMWSLCSIGVSYASSVSPRDCQRSCDHEDDFLGSRLRGFTVADGSASSQHPNAARDAEDLIEIVADDEHGQSLAFKLEDYLFDRLGLRDAKRRRWLVHEDEF
jgi:hypothetical protein